MYTFAPLQPLYATYDGFYFLCIVCTAFLVYGMFNIEYVKDFVWLVVPAGIVILLAYFVSYHWIDNTTVVYKNTPVVAKLVGYQAEGYMVSERQGKQTKDVPYHFTYVVYRLPDNSTTLFKSTPGIPYPESAILYKN